MTQDGVIGETKCEWCGQKLAMLLNHYEEHLPISRKINVCNGCHLRLHTMSMREQCFPRIKIPRTSFPFFQYLYRNVVIKRTGEVLIDGEAIFNARYEIVEDSEWQGTSLLDSVPKLKALIENSSQERLGK